MDAESMAFGAPVVGMVVGAIVLVVGVFQGGLTTLAVAGGLLVLLSIAWLTYSVTAIE